MSTPISAMIAWAAVRSIPGIASSRSTWSAKGPISASILEGYSLG
jgi:hypothetical protein